LGQFFQPANRFIEASFHAFPDDEESSGFERLNQRDGRFDTVFSSGRKWSDVRFDWNIHPKIRQKYDRYFNVL